MRVYGVQLDIAWEDKAANYDEVRGMVARAEPEAGSLIVLPEMFATGFSMNVGAIGEEVEGATYWFARDLAREWRCHVVAGVATRQGEAAKGLNQAIVVGPMGKQAARYSKVHPFSMGKEAGHYDGGTEVVLFDWGGMKVCPVICYDLRFPELFRVAALRGAEMFVVIANFPAARAGHWKTLLAARAIENQAYVLGVNRTGNDPWIAYCGDSMLVDPKGVVVAEAGAAEGILKADVDPEAVRAWREEFPVLADVRKHLLGDAWRRGME